jgi:hypothetical protein
VAERSGGQVILCAVCVVHVETRSTCFLVEPQNQGQQFVSGLASNLLRQFVSGLTSEPDILSVVWPQNHGDSFSRFGLETGDDGFL